MKSHPAVPAPIVVRHLQASKNRVQRAVLDSERVRQGRRALREDAMRLRATLRGREEDLAVLEQGLAASDFVLSEIEGQNEALIQIEQALQNELQLWLLRKEPLVRLAAPRAHEIHHVPSKGHEIPTPARPVQGEEVPTPAPDPKKPVGFYTMADGTRVFVNAANEPVSFSTPQPDGTWLHTDTDRKIVEPPAVPEIAPASAETEPAPAYTPLAPEAPTLEGSAPTNGAG